MSSITKISFSSCYYIRKVLIQNADELKSMVASKVGFCPNCQADLEQLLESVYLEEILEQLLQRLYLEETEIAAKVRQLENLALRHQALETKSLSHYEELIEVRREIFWLLGLKRVIVKIDDLVRALNQLSEFSNNYLGSTLTSNNWRSTRPQFDWLDNFQINRSAEFAFSGIITETVSLVQLQSIQEWVSAFIKQSSQIIRDFATIIEQKKIGELQDNILLTRVTSYSSWLPEKIKNQVSL